MKKQVLAAFGVGVALAAAPGNAFADVESLTIDTTSDSGALSACTAAAGDCSLRGAASVVNDADPPSDQDTLTFDTTIFDGTESTPGDATVVEATAVTFNDSVVLQGSCPVASTDHPCAGIDGPAGDNAINVTDETLSMSSVAIFGTGFQGIFFGGTGDGLVLSNDWFGLKLDGTVSGNGIGVNVTGTNASIGGVNVSPNVFAGNTIGVQVFAGATNTAIQGSLFGVKQNAALAPNTTDIDVSGNVANLGPSNVSIGAPDNGTPACDAGCNVIASAGGLSGRGINLAGDGTPNFTSSSSDVTIQGNHIGMSAAGTASSGSGVLVAVGGADQVTVAGNHLAGGLLGITSGSTASDLLVTGNTIGTTSDGTTVLDGTLGNSIFANSPAATPTSVTDNLVAKDSGNSTEAIVIGNTGATVTGNSVGLEGATGSGGSVGISVAGGSHSIRQNTIVETTGDAIVFGQTSGSEAAENVIGTTDGPIGGNGISVIAAPGNSAGNAIGSNDPSLANHFENVAGDAIRIVGDGQDQNQILANLGLADGLFVDLEGTDGPGNGAGGPNNEIAAPKVKKVEKKQASGTGIAGATIWLYRSESEKKEVPSGLNRFIATKTVKNDGTWKVKPDKNFKGKDVLTALQVDPSGNSSELAKGKQTKK